MAHSRCPFLLIEYIGQASGALCGSNDDKDCPNKIIHRQLSPECWHHRALRKRPTGYTRFGTGEPTAPKPPETS